MDQTLYDMLGVSRKASQKEISRAYRSLAQKYHPDVQNQKETLLIEGAEELSATQSFKLITFAYNTLRDPETRRNYDATLGLDMRNLRRRHSDTATGVFGIVRSLDDEEESYCIKEPSLLDRLLYMIFGRR